jgi:hypothetical protein
METRDFTVDLVGALKLALSRRGALPTLLGSAVALVPIGGYYLGHFQLSSWNPLEDPSAVLAYAALSFSAMTVYTWGRAMFDSTFKGLAFSVLVEGLMMFGESPTLAYVALALIVLINAMTCGCRLALRSAPTTEPTTVESAAPRVASLPASYRHARLMPRTEAVLQ